MSKLLNKYNERFVNSLSGDGKSVMPEIMDKFFQYRKALEEGTTIEVFFDFADNEGNLSLKDKNGIMICLRSEEFKKTNRFYSEKKKANFIGIALEVKVTEIDTKNDLVYVKSAVGTENIRGAFISEICKELKKGNHPVLSGTVLFVNDNRVIVNILNQSILGIINAKDWRPTYTRFLSKVAKKDDVVQFAVMELPERKKGKDISFICSRREIMTSPWDAIEDIDVGSVITVKCIDKPKDKLYFWGFSSRLPEIDVMCDYNSNLEILTGVYYKCKVRTFDKEEKKLQVVPFAVMPMGIGTVENIEFLTKKRKKKEV